MVVLQSEPTDRERGAIILETYLQRLVDEADANAGDVLATLTRDELIARASADAIDGDALVALEWLIAGHGNFGYDPLFSSGMEYFNVDDDDGKIYQAIHAVARWLWYAVVRGDAACSPTSCAARLIGDGGYRELVSEVLATWPTTPMSAADGRVLLDAVARSGSLQHATELADHGVHICTHPLLIENAAGLDALDMLDMCMHNSEFLVEWLCHRRTADEIVGLTRVSCYEDDFDVLALAIEADATGTLFTLLGAAHDAEDMRQNIWDMSLITLMAMYWRAPAAANEHQRAPSIADINLGFRHAGNYSLAYLYMHLSHTSVTSTLFGDLLRWLVRTGPPLGCVGDEDGEVHDFMRLVAFLARNDVDDLASLVPITCNKMRPYLEAMQAPTPWRALRARRSSSELPCVRCADRV